MKKITNGIFFFLLVVSLCANGAKGFSFSTTIETNQDGFEKDQLESVLIIDKDQDLDKNDKEKEKTAEESGGFVQDKEKTSSGKMPQDKETDDKNPKDELEGGKDQTLQMNLDGHERLQNYDESIEDDVFMDLKYKKYWIKKHYVVVLRNGVNIRSGPGTKYPVKKRGYFGQKFSLEETVKGQYFSKSDSDHWHRISWWKNGKAVYGYVYAPIVSQRQFRFKTMLEKIKQLGNDISTSQTAHIYNVGNSVGSAPRYKGKLNFDDYNIPRYQAAPAYQFPKVDTNVMRYIQDGLLISILGEENGYYKVQTYDYPGVYYVPKKYITQRRKITQLNQVVAVDIKNQNQVVFEKRGENWHIISYTYATTGAKSKYKEPTISGSYQVIGKQSFFRYRDDVEKHIAGYAPYAIRFNGGAFIHGVPVNYKLVKKPVLVRDEVLDERGFVLQEKVFETQIVDRIDPGHIEYMSSLGTIPLSHKCVRNATSHAHFLYKWTILGQAAVVVFD